VNGPLKWHGGKFYLASRIVALMPPRCKNPNKPAMDDPGYLHYVEPYFGGGAVLLANDPEGISEVANDLNLGLINFWRVLSLPKPFEAFRRRMEATPFSELYFDLAQLAKEIEYVGDGTPEENSVNAAVSFFILCRQSLAGRMSGFPGLTKTRTRRGMNNEVSAWLSCIEGLPAVHERLRRVLILNRPALEVIEKHDGPRTLFYLDPPYLHETRATTGEYAHEMTEADHAKLLATVRFCKGKVMLSGYASDLYDRVLVGWNRHVFELPNQAAGGKEKRRMEEIVWCNF
jgi:DNA adenine methylase